MRFERLIIGSVIIVLLILVIFNYSTEISNYNDGTGSGDNNNYRGDVIDLTISFTQIYKFMPGTIVAVDNDGFEVSMDYSGDIYKVKTSQKVDYGNIVFIVGNIMPNNEIDAVKFVQFDANMIGSVILRSIIGLILFLIIFLYYWKFDFKEMFFIRRK